jgi:hypothetical protein
MRRAVLLTSVAGIGAAALVGLAIAQPAPTPPPAETPPAAIETPPSPTTAPVAVEAPPDEAPIPEAEAAPENVTAAAPPPPPEPIKRPRFASAILQAVDKTTAETLRFEAKVNEPVRYKGLVLTVHACERTAPDEAARDTFAHLDVQARPDAQSMRAPQREVFRGWMFASSPGLHPLEHPAYDVWLIACKAAPPDPAAAKPSAAPAPKPPAASAPPAPASKPAPPAAKPPPEPAPAAA